MDPPPASITTEQESTLDDIIKQVERFRILVIGRSGVGKSSLINRVFGINNAQVEDQKVGEADIEREFMSPQNQFFVLHDSKGFEPGDLDNFEIVRKFVDERSKQQHLKDRIHGLWLCTETPTAGGRIFETGDEKLLKFAHENEVPLVLVFTQYDRLVRTKQFQLRATPDIDAATLHRRSVEGAQEVFDTCLESLKVTTDNLVIPMPTLAKVSVRPGYENDISSLVQVTTNVAKERVKGDAWVLWSMAQRASLPIKIETCITKGINHYLQAMAGTLPGFGQWILLDCLEKIHKDIITCWNFKGEVLNSPEFRGLMIALIQDVRTESGDQTSPNISSVSQLSSLAGAVSTPLVPAFGALSLAFLSARWLQMTLGQNLSEVQRLLIAYIVDLVKVLTELFDITIRVESALTTTLVDLHEAFESYEKSDSRRSIHDSIRSNKPMKSLGEISREIRRLLVVK